MDCTLNLLINYTVRYLISLIYYLFSFFLHYIVFSVKKCYILIERWDDYEKKVVITFINGIFFIQ